jgi:hypothetical protein
MPMVIYSPIAMHATMNLEKTKSTGLEESLCKRMKFWLTAAP